MANVPLQYVQKRVLESTEYCLPHLTQTLMWVNVLGM